MAKKKEQEVEVDLNVVAEKAIDDMIKKYGDIFESGQQVIDRKRQIISVSPAIDIALRGGVPEGCLVILTGREKLGKTQTGLAMAANAQKMGKKVFYINVEARLGEKDITGSHQLSIDPAQFQCIRSRPGNMLTAEKFLGIAHDLCNTQHGAFILVDSFSALCSEAEFTGSMEEQQRADVAKLTKKFCRKVSQILPINNVTLVGITHVQADPSGQTKGYRESGGSGLAYQHDVKLWAKYKKFWKLSDDADPIGQEVYWDISTSALGPPGGKAVSWLRYGYGLDKEMEVIDLASDCGFITKKGAWLSIEGTDIKECGKEKFRDRLLEKPELYHQLNQSVLDLMGIRKDAI